jgi:hypothetical protein
VPVRRFRATLLLPAAGARGSIATGPSDTPVFHSLRRISWLPRLAVSVAVSVARPAGAEAAAHSQPGEALEVGAAGSRPQAKAEVALACSRLEAAWVAGSRPGEEVVVTAAG